MVSIIDLRVRFVGHPPDDAIRTISFDPNSTVENLRKYFNDAYFLTSHYITCQFLFRSKVISPDQTIASLIKAGFAPKKDVLTIMATGEKYLLRKEPKLGAPPFTDAQMDAIIQQLEEDITPFREEAAQLLGISANTRRAVPPLLKVLKDPYCRLRELAVESLGKLGDPKIVNELKEMLGDPNPDVVQAVTQALKKLENLN